MILHIFNPEHDIALAGNQKHFVAPHAARQLRTDLGFLPALWAGKGDLILVNNIASARTHFRRFERYACHCHLIDAKLLSTIRDNISQVMPWGWDAAVRQTMLDAGVDERILPSDGQLEMFREMSNRQFSANILYDITHAFNGKGLVGKAHHVTNATELELFLHTYKQAVVKAPWSSSGRGVRYLDYDNLDKNLLNWALKVIKRQGGVMIEPYYNKVRDFGMEFFANGSSVDYEGISLFQTANGAYTGNLLLPESKKMELLSAYFAPEFILHIIEMMKEVLTKHIRGHYTGPFGVDMMIVPNTLKDTPGEPPFLLHPMVELNLRRTMGHVAIALSEHEELHNRMMRTDYDGSHYHLHFINKGVTKK